MASQVLVNVVGLADLAMVGRLGADALAAVGYATQFYFLSQSVLMAVGFACVALMSQALGGGHVQQARTALATSLTLAFGGALVLAAGMLAAPIGLLGLLGAEAGIAALALPYLSMVLAATPLLAISLTLESGLRAAKDTRTPMRISMMVTLVKLGLNPLLIFGLFGFPELGLLGAGLATLLSQIVGVALFAWVVVGSVPGAPLALRTRDFRGVPAMAREVLRVATPSVGERLAHTLALLAYFRVLSSYGAVAIAAYTVGVRLLSFSWIPGTGIGTAASTIVGHALGREDPAEATRAGWRSVRLALGVACVSGLAIAFMPAQLGALFTDDPALLAVLVPFLLSLAAAQPGLQAHFALAGAHRGAGDTWTPFVAAVGTNWGIRVPLAYVAGPVLGGGILWVWWVVVVDHTARALWLAASFARSGARSRLRT
jgi:putative MATE family efflux protein